MTPARVLRVNLTIAAATCGAVLILIATGSLYGVVRVVAAWWCLAVLAWVLVSYPLAHAAARRDWRSEVWRHYDSRPSDPTG